MSWLGVVALALGIYALSGAIVARSPLGLLNFLILQWVGVRLQAEFDREAWLAGSRGRWWAADAPQSGPIAWSLLRWIWPLTGWWSGYRYIRLTRRRPTVCRNHVDEEF